MKRRGRGGKKKTFQANKKAYRQREIVRERTESGWKRERQKEKETESHSCVCIFPSNGPSSLPYFVFLSP